jgi:eukaryotic-like serine/threonine-protein kinase
VAERQFGPYRLVRQIAVGGMAELHLAKTKGIAGFEKYCALKMIHPNFAEDEQFIQMLVDEAKIAVELTHGNIAQTFDLGHVGDTYYITMEYVDGADLYKILRRASEQDLEMPLDVCAFIAKEIASALDYAHRKRDHTGKALGIVHRDVSPQNVLISYAGEVKLVDFGIAKATMKARQTAVGVIKGKYYYMSPEQAWGDRIDYRSDIFSTGIVLYEMMTGQMLYLEEDLHKLLDMARKADIAPPSRLRKGIPPQLERIVMHALGKGVGDRYQSAADLASDLERFLHGYAPVFTAGKLAGLIRKVVGDPMQVPTDEVSLVEQRDGVNSTHALDTADLIHERDEIRDENSVIFRVSDLSPGQSTAPGRAAAPTPAKGQARPVAPTPAKGQARPVAPTPAKGQPAGSTPVPRTTRAADPLPSMRAQTETPAPVAARQPRPSSGVPRPRGRDEDTRPVAQPAPSDPGRTDDSGLLTADGRKVDPATWDRTATFPGLEDDLENIGERTLVTGGMGGFMMDVATEGDGIEATLVNVGPPQPPEPTERTDVDEGSEPTNEITNGAGREDEDGPTLTRDPPRVSAGKKMPPPALAAKIHAPAVSELRKPRPSRRTPPGGVPVPQPNVLQQIVASKASEPMPVPRTPPPTPVSTPSVPPPPQPLPLQSPASPQQQVYPAAAPPPPPSQYPAGTPGVQPQYVHDASGLPMGVPTPPAGVPAAAPGQALYPAPGQPGAPGYPQNYPQNYPGYPPQPYAPAQSPYPVSPGGLYQMSPFGQPPPPVSLTGALRLTEGDEIPSQYKIPSRSRRWLAYVVAGLIAVSVAAGSTFFIISMTRQGAPTSGLVRIGSVPAGGDVYVNNNLTGKAPLTIERPVGTRLEIRVELARHRPFAETVEIPKTGAELSVNAMLQPITGKIVVSSQPAEAEIWIDGQLRGRTPTTLNDIDVGTAKKLELRLKGYQPFVTALDWPPDGQITLNPKLSR